MFSTNRLFISGIFLLFLGCGKKEVLVPGYILMGPPTLITKSDNSQGFPSALVEDYYVFHAGAFRGIYGLGAHVPIQGNGSTPIRLSSAIKYNGMAEQRAVYPFFTDYSTALNLKEGVVDTVRPVFSYLDNTVFPLIEDYEGSGLALEYNTQSKQAGDTLILDNSNDAWLPGKYSGKIQLNSAVPDSYLEMYSKVFSDWPRFTPFFLELDYKGNIPIVVGMYATTSFGEVSRFPMFILNPKDGWNKLYLDLETEINKRGPGIQYRIFLGFAKGNTPNPVAWIDNLKVLYLD